MRLPGVAVLAERGLLAMVYAVPLTVTWTVAGAHIALGVGAASALVLGVATRRLPLARSSADVGWIAWALAVVLSCAFATPEAATWMPIKKVALILSVPVVAAVLCTAKRLVWALRLVVIATSLTALLATLHFLWVPHAADARLRGTTHYMTFAGLLLLALPGAGCAAWQTRGPARLAYAAAAAILSFALLLTFTRSAWLGALLAALLVLARLRARLLPLVPVLALVAFPLLPGAYQDRALSAFDPSHATNQDRQRLWRAGLEMWHDHPWTGVGPGDLKRVYKRYNTSGEGRVHGHLHSNWVHILASMGSLGLVAFIWLQVLLARLLWRASRAARDRELQALAIGAWAAFGGFHLMGLFEWNWGDVEVTIALYFVLGACSALEQQRGTGVTRHGFEPPGHLQSRQEV